MSSPVTATFTLSSSPSSGRLYVPVHRRTPSSSSASGSTSSSPRSAVIDLPPVAPSAYSIDQLLAMRPLADESMKQKMRETCPEVVMNRKMRKTAEFTENQRRKQALLMKSAPAPVAAISPALTTVSLPSSETDSHHNTTHRHQKTQTAPQNEVEESSPQPILSAPIPVRNVQAVVSKPTRLPSRRTRTGVRTGGAADRRRSALAESWRKVPALNAAPVVAL